MRLPSRQYADVISNNNSETEIDGKWVAARPEPYYWWKERFVLAWAVFTGKADALFWHKQ